MWPIATHVPGVVCLCVYVTGMYPTKTAEPIEMSFYMWVRVSQHNHVLDGDPDFPPGEGAIFWTNIDLHSSLFTLTSV